MATNEFSEMFSDNFSWFEQGETSAIQNALQLNRYNPRQNISQNSDLIQLKNNLNTIQSILGKIDQVCMQLCDKNNVQRVRSQWNQSEHKFFIQAVEKYGKQNIRQIIQQMQQLGFTEQQVRTHASKYFRKISNISKKSEQECLKLIKDNNLIYPDKIYIQYSNNPRITETMLFDKLVKPILQHVNIVDVPLSVNSINSAIITLINSYRCIPYEYIYELTTQTKLNPVHELLITAIQGTFTTRLKRQYNIFGYLIYTDVNDIHFKLVSPHNNIRCFGVDQQLTSEENMEAGKEPSEQTFCCFQMNIKPFIRFCIQHVTSFILKKQIDRVLQFVYSVAHHFETSQDGINYIIKYQAANYSLTNGEAILFAFITCFQYFKSLK